MFIFGSVSFSKLSKVPSNFGPHSSLTKLYLTLEIEIISVRRSISFIRFYYSIICVVFLDASVTLFLSQLLFAVVLS